MTSSTKYCAANRLPTRRPYMSGKAAMIVSMSPSETRRFRVSTSILPGMISLAHIDVDRLPFGVVVERLQSELTSEAALLHPAEGSFQMDAAPGIDRKISSLHGARDTHGATDIARPDRARQAVVAVVGHGDRSGFVIEGHHRDDRSEDLLASDLHVGPRIQKNGWLEIAARAIGRVAPGRERGALVPSDLDILHDSLAMRCGDQRSHL